MHPHLTTWDGKYENVLTQANLTYVYGGGDGRDDDESGNRERVGGIWKDAEGEQDEGEVTGESGVGGILDNLSETEKQNGDIKWNEAGSAVSLASLHGRLSELYLVNICAPICLQPRFVFSVRHPIARMVLRLISATHATTLV